MDLWESDLEFELAKKTQKRETWTQRSTNRGGEEDIRGGESIVQGTDPQGSRSDELLWGCQPRGPLSDGPNGPKTSREVETSPGVCKIG